MIVLHGVDLLPCPAAGQWGRFIFKPGAKMVDKDHWDAICALDDPVFQAALKTGKIGPATETPPPKAKPKGKPKAEPKPKAEAKPKPKPTPASKPKAKPKAKKG